MNKYNPILSEYALVKNLTKSEIEILSFLIENYKGEPLTYSNKDLIQATNIRIETISRCIAKLNKLGLLEVSYMPHRNGTKRFIKVLRSKNEN